MKSLSFNFLTSVIIVLFLFFASCDRPDKNVFKIAPEETMLCVTFNPGSLMKKGNLKELNFIQQGMQEDKLFKEMMEDPDQTGIETDAYSTFFIFGDEVQYGCISMPMKDKTKFEEFIDKIEIKINESFEIETFNGFEGFYLKNTFVAWNSSIAFTISELEGWSDKPLMEVAEEITDLEKNYSLLADKNFNSFLSDQKDINAWANSTNISEFPGAEDFGDAMDIFGGLKNNYGHMYLEFQDDAIILTTDTKFNVSLKETIDKYNFLDSSAKKEMLRYLPADKIFFVANTSLNPEKIIDLLEFVNADLREMFDEMEEKLGITENEIKNAFKGDVAFALNGMKKTGESERDFLKKFPVFVGVASLKSEKIFDSFIEFAKTETEVKELEGYYVVSTDIPVYMAKSNGNAVITTNEAYIKEITVNNKMVKNLADEKLASVLTEKPVCLFLAMDNGSYTRDMMNSIGGSFPMEFEFIHSMKSVSFQADIEEMQFIIDLNESEENSLSMLLKTVE